MNASNPETPDDHASGKVFPPTRVSMVEGMTRGENAAWDRFMDTYQERAIRYVENRFGSRDFARDVFQQVSLYMWKFLSDPDYRYEPGRFGGFLTKKLTFTAYDELKKAAKRSRDVSLDDPDSGYHNRLEARATVLARALDPAKVRRELIAIGTSERDASLFVRARTIQEQPWIGGEEQQDLAAEVGLSKGRVSQIAKAQLELFFNHITQHPDRFDAVLGSTETVL